ncbi:hypothetical protein [Methylobacterium sp. JK268]
MPSNLVACDPGSPGPPPVLADPAAILLATHLSPAEKRATLAAWASDAHAVESDPALRWPPGTAGPMRIDAILSTLRRLDRAVHGSPPRPPTVSVRHRLHRSLRTNAWSDWRRKPHNPW